MLFVDSDNALGSPSGDVDDGYALAALVLSRVEIAAISSCRGNTDEQLAFANNAALTAFLGWGGRLLRADVARSELAAFEGRVLALGPLTNVANVQRASEVIIVGSNWSSSGRWPPLWPYEFNLTKDRQASVALFHSTVPLTIFPLDVVRQLTATRSDIVRLPGAVGSYLAQRTRRWFSHLRWTRFTGHFPIYDLAAALYAIADDGFEWVETTASMNSFTSIAYGTGSRPVRVCTSIDRERLWQRFVSLLGSSC